MPTFHQGTRGSLRACEVMDRTGPRALPSPVYEQVNQKKKYVTFINKINRFTINKVQNKSFEQGFKIFQDGFARNIKCTNSISQDDISRTIKHWEEGL